MKKLKITAGILWAIIGLVLILILFPRLNSFSKSASKLPFMKINARYTGGVVAKQIIEDKCTLNIHIPVFNGLFKERRTGFVQLDWHGAVPEIIKDSADYNNDGLTDFRVLINRSTSKTEFQSENHKVNGVIMSTKTSYGWALRVGLSR